MAVPNKNTAWHLRTLADKPVIIRIRAPETSEPLICEIQLHRPTRTPAILERALVLDRGGRGSFFGWMPDDLEGVSVRVDGTVDVEFDIRPLSYAELIVRLTVFSPKTVARALYLLAIGNTRGFQYRLIRLLDSMNAPTYADWRALHSTASPPLAGPARDLPEVLYTIIGDDQGALKSRVSFAQQTYPHLREVALPADITASADSSAIWMRVPAGMTMDADAVLELARPLAEDNVIAAYSDEDYLDGQTKSPLPFFKPAFNRPLAQSGWLAPDGAAIRVSALPRDLDLQGCTAGELLLAASAQGAVAHIPQPLLHRNTDRPKAKAKAAPAVKKIWAISVIIPTRDRADLMTLCLEGLLSKTSNVTLDIIVIDNDSSDETALRLFKSYEDAGHIRRILMPGKFNFAKASNLGVQAAKHDLVLLLNNDVEPLHPEWLGQMATELEEQDVGICGALLLFPDGFVQHGGVTLGAGSVARHSFHFRHPDAGEDFQLLSQRREVSAVTAACLLTRKTVWSEVGGMNEQHLAVAFNDVDYCLKVLTRGHKIIWTPHARLSHLESVSRKADDTEEKKARFAAEEKYMHDQWGPLLANDPHYNPNLSLVAGDYVLDAMPRDRNYRFADVKAPRQTMGEAMLQNASGSQQG